MELRPEATGVVIAQMADDCGHDPEYWNSSDQYCELCRDEDADVYIEQLEAVRDAAMAVEADAEAYQGGMSLVRDELMGNLAAELKACPDKDPR